MLCVILMNILSIRFEPAHDKTNKMACAPSQDSDQPGHPPSLIRVFAVRMKEVEVLSYLLCAQRRLWSDWADAQADLSLRWAHMPFCWFCHALAHFVFLEDRKYIPKLSIFASWPGDMINPQWLELPISRTNFHGPRDVWAIEVQLYLAQL